MTLTNQRGVTYLLAMFAVVLIGISLMVTGQQWSVIVKRDREAELRFRGNRIQEAIARYAADYEVQKAFRPHRYPLKLEDLTQGPRRYLQAIYTDPITGKDFEVIKVGAEIHGVRSTSQDAPLDQVHFKGAETYHAIKFEATGGTGCSPNPLNPTLPSNCPPPSSGQTPSPSGSPTTTGQTTNPTSE